MENRRTAEQVRGFRGRSGRSFNAKLKLVQNEEGSWRVDFDEEWATGVRPETVAEGAAESAEAATAAE